MEFCDDNNYKILLIFEGHRNQVWWFCFNYIGVNKTHDNTVQLYINLLTLSLGWIICCCFHDANNSDKNFLQPQQ